MLHVLYHQLYNLTSPFIQWSCMNSISFAYLGKYMETVIIVSMQISLSFGLKSNYQIQSHFLYAPFTSHQAL